MMNFFVWVREGVKHSVMQGFADAVEAIGVPPGDESSSQQLLENLRGGATALAAPVSKPQGKHKRLGRSLSHLRPDTDAA